MSSGQRPITDQLEAELGGATGWSWPQTRVIQEGSAMIVESGLGEDWWTNDVELPLVAASNEGDLVVLIRDQTPVTEDLVAEVAVDLDNCGLGASRRQATWGRPNGVVFEVAEVAVAAGVGAVTTELVRQIVRLVERAMERVRERRQDEWRHDSGYL